MGITAASATLLFTSAKTSVDSGQETISPSGASFIAASWLKEPGSPWIAIFIAFSVPQLSVIYSLSS
jgi:hypothetical protein